MNMVAGTVDWGVAESGSPGVYSWQHLYNWNEPGLHQTPLLVPKVTGDIANLNLVNLTGNQVINLDGAVTLGGLNLGDTSGNQSYTLAAGSGGALTLNNGGLGATINKSGLGYDFITANVALAENATITVNDGALGITGVISGTGFGLTKEGNGMLILRGSNTYTGATVLNGGTTLLVPTANDGAVLGTTAGITTVNNGATLALGPDAAGSGAIGNPAEPITINGNGFRNNGALRNLMGANGAGITSVITLGSASRIQNDLAGTLTIASAMNVNQDLRIGGASFVSLTGVVSGSNPITHYGINGFRFQGASTYSGTISSELGEIRADTQGAYNNVSAFNIKNGVLQIVNPNNANVTGTKLPDAAPINLTSGRLYVENSAFGGTGLNPAFTYTETVGAVTILAGHNQIGMRAMATTGANTLTIASLSRPNAATTLQLSVDSVPTGGSQLGLNTQNRLLNTALETAGVTVPFIGGWAYTNAEFVKYVPTSLGGNGYTAFVAGDYSSAAETGWNNTLIVKPSAAVTLTADRQVQAIHLNSQTISGAFELNVDTGGIMANGASNINTSFLTAGAAENYELKAISWSTLGLNTVIRDNGGNPVSFVKAGGSTTSFFQSNTYTGTTYINEGMLRDVIGVPSRTGLGGGNLTFYGYGGGQGVYETDRDFTRALGSGAGQVQLLGGTGSGFSAFGAPIDLNFGGAGATVTWGSSTFNPGIFTLNGGNATHVVTMINPLDLGGEQRYIRLDGSASGSERGVIGIIAGDVSNGSIVKRGGGVLLFDTPKSYEGGTLIQEGELWLRGTGTAGANVTGNDIQVGSFGRLRINDPSNIGSRQLIILQNNDSSSATGITFGPGYGTGAGITFSSLTATGGVPASGPYNILIANNQSGQGRRVGVTISGLNNFQSDLLAQIATVAPNVEAWFGADNGNGVYTGSTLTATGSTKAFRLGGFNGTGGTLTIANANVLTGAFPLIVGNSDQNDRQYTDGTIYIPQSQNYSGQVTIGSGGILHVGNNGALSTGNNTILMRAGELRVETMVGGYNALDTQYGARIVNFTGGNGTLRTSAISGGGYNTITMGDMVYADTGTDRALVVGTLGTIFTNLQVSGITMPNAARTLFIDVGADNNFQSGIGALTVTGIIGDQATGAQTLQKRNGGPLVLQADNTYDGNTLVQQGRLVLEHVGAAGSAATSLQFNTNNDRRSDIEFRLDGSGPFVIPNASISTGTAGNDGSTRVLTAGPITPGNENQVVVLPSLTIAHAGAYAVNGGTSSALYFDGFNGYQFQLGDVALNRSIVLRTRGALTTVNGVISGAAANALEKSEQGTLWLNGNNTYAGTTTISNGYLIAGHDNAFGAATSNVVFRNNVFSQILASGVRTISRNFENTATGSSQTLGGLDAGLKTFSGNVILTSQGINVTSTSGGDVNFTGTVSGGFGLTKVGTGTVVLNPTSGTGNTLTGAITVQGGTLQGQAQAVSGSPFGVNNAFTITNGVLKLEGQAAPSASSNTASTGTLTLNGGNAGVVVNDAAADTFDTQLTFGGLTRTGNSTLTLRGNRTGLGATVGEERVTFTSAPAVNNGTIGTWAVHQGAGTANAAHYVTVDGGNNVITAAYSGTGDLDTSAGSTTLFDATGTGGTLTSNRSVYAFRTDSNVALAGFTLNVGDANAATLGQAGFILNNGADITGIAGSKLNIGTNALSVYTDDAAVSSINVPIANYRNNATNTMSNVLTKFGPGTLEMGALGTFQGGIVVNQGVLSLTAANVIPTFENLNAVTGSIVTIRPGASVLLNNNNQEFGNLAAVNQGAEFQFSGGVLNLGTATLTVGREGSNQTFSGQLIGGAGSKLVKIGGGTLTINNYNAAMANSLGTLEINQGAIATRHNDQSWATPTAFASSLPSTTDVYLRGGTWQVRTIGDSTGNLQRIAIGNNIVSIGGDSVLNTVRDQGGGSNKLLTFGNLTLGVQRFLTNNDNTIIPRFDGTTTLTNYGRIQTDNQLVLAGAISGNYSLEKRGASDLTIGANNSSWNGGMVLTDGTLLFGNRGTDDVLYQGTTFVPSATANAGTGDLVVNRGTVIRLNAPSNILSAQGQRVQLIGSEAVNSTRVELGTDAPITSYNLFSISNAQLALNLNEGLWTNTIDLAKVGNGRAGVSAVSNTYYTAATLGAGIDNVYRFGGSNAATLAITQSGALSGTASLDVGRPHYIAGANPGSTEAVVRLYGDQTYTGVTNIYREADGGIVGAILELTGDSKSSAFNVYGRLTLRGDGRVTNDAGTQVNTVNLFPGGNLRLDYSMDVADNFIISRLDNSNLGLETDENKWGDSTPMVLDGAGLNLINHSGRVNQEVVGAITVKGGAGITLERNGGSGQMVLSTPSITRATGATLSIRPTSSSTEFGTVALQSSRLLVTGGGPELTMTNGIVAPWMVDMQNRNFLNYDNALGFGVAAFQNGTPVAGSGDAFLSTFTGTEIVRFQGGWGDTALTGTKNVYALRVDEESGTNDMVFTGGQINIWSGGLIAGADDTNRVNFDTTNVYFGNGTTPVEGLIYGGHASTVTRFGATVTANNLTFTGPGAFQLAGTANAITGVMQMNGGTLYIDGNGARGSATEIILHGNYANNFNGGQMPSLRLRHNSATTTYTGLTVTIAENVPYAQIQAERFSGTGTTNEVQFGSLVINGTSGPAGTTLLLSNSNSNAQVLGTTTIGGSSPVSLSVNANTWRLAGAVSGSAPIYKTGTGILRLDGNNTGLSSPVFLNAGEIQGIGSNTNNFFGTGDYVLNSGILRIQHNNTGSYFTAAGQDITLAGAVTFVSNRNGGANASNLTIGTNNGTNTLRTLNGAQVRLIADSFGDDYYFEGKTYINDSAVFLVDSSEVFMRDTISGNGKLTKTGIWYMYLDNNAANPDWHGTIDIQNGTLALTQANATLGGSDSSVIVRAGSALSLSATSQFGTGNGVTQVFTSNLALPVLGVRNQANFASVLGAYAGKIVGTGTGVVALDGNQTLATDPAMSTLFGGNWWLGSVSGNGTLSANSIAPWGASGNEFRFGGGSNTITLNPATAGSAQLAGAGNKLIVGVPHDLFGQGVLAIGANASNTFDGGTLVNRSRNMDGGYRASALSIQGGANGTTTTFRTPLGTGNVDLFGEARIEGASGTAVTTGLGNANTWIVHPGSRLRFDNGTPFTGSGTTGNLATGTLGGNGRWSDTVGITLDGAVLDMVGDDTDHIANREIIGDLTIKRGAEVVVRHVSGTTWTELVAASVARNGTGTLMLRHDTNQLGVAGAASAERFIVTGGAGVTSTNNMVDPWIVSRSENQFLKYDATNGFQVITAGTAPANYLTSVGGTIDGTTLPLNNGTEILNLNTATGTLGVNADVHALRVDRDINVSADGQFNKIIIRSGGLLQAANTPTINPDLYFGSAGNGTGEALIWANNNTLQINGKIYASQVTKSGTAFLNVRSDQPQFTGNWVINGGGVQFLTPNAASTGEVILNGSHMADNDSVWNLTEVRYNFNSGTPDLFTWGGGKITGYDINRVYVVTATDRLQQIPAIDLRTTNAVAGTGMEGTMFLQADGLRSTVRTGTVTLFDHYLVHVESGSFGTGASTGFQFGSGNGTGGLVNGGTFNLRKVGDGVLTLGDISSTFTGSTRIEVGEGALRVTSPGSLGAAAVTARFGQGAALEIATAGWSPTAVLDQMAGSFERWAVDGARSGTVNLPSGVHLQIMQNQTGTQTINLNGGSIMGYMPRDWDHVAVITQMGSGLTINLTANSYLGQPFVSSSNGVWDYRFYDLGKQNTMGTDVNINDQFYRGSYLQIDGAITGAFDLTKTGKDMILLNGANTYNNTIVEDGILQIGRVNGLPVAGALTLKTSTAMFDLNGNDQEIAALTGPAGSINNGRFDYNTLTVNQATDTTFAGTVDGNVTLLKKGAGTLALSPVAANGSTLTGNGYLGGTILEAGRLSIAQDNALGLVPLQTDADNVKFTGGTLLTTASFTVPVSRGITLDSAGGTIETSPAVVTQINSVVTGSGSLTKAGSGTLQLNNAANDFTGTSLVMAGVLKPGAVDALAPLSRHTISGDAVSGTLNLAGLNQTIGSLSSTGSVEGNAVVAFAATETLTVGADRSQDAVYAGAITGAGVFRVNGNGAIQTLAVADNSAQTWNTQIANGVLNVASGAKLAAGSAAVQIGVAGVTGADDFTGLHLQNTAVMANNLVVNNVNSVGSAVISASGSNAALTGTVTLDRNVYVGAATGSQLSLENTVSGNGTITVVDGGTVRLTSANTFGAGVSGTSGTPMAGGTVVRAGSVLLENNTAAGTQAIALGDQTSTISVPVDRATFSSILGSGSFNPNGDGVSATSGGQNSSGTTGFGAFIGVSSTVDGNSYTSGDVGTRLLIAGEEANPERNGIYTIVSVNGSTMNLVRADDFETSNQIKYGAQVAVNNGTYAGMTMFQMEEQIVVRNETTLEPIRFRQDVANPNLSVLQNVSGLTVANDIKVNATNGTGTMSVGGSSAVTSGTGAFTGTLQLQNFQPGVAESKTVQLVSSTTTGNGISFTGQINAVDQIGGTADVLSITKTGSGTVTLSHANNNFLGSTTVSEGRLQVGNGGAAGTGSLTGTGAVSVTGAGTTLATAPVLAGGSANTTIAGAVTIGTATNPGILAPGLGDSSTSNQTMTFSSAGGVVVASGSQLQMSLSVPTLNASNGTVSAWLASNQDLNTYLTANPASVSLVNVAPATYGDMDYINLTGGTLSLGTRSSGTFGNGSLLVQDNGWLSGAAAGDLFNLFDWVSALTGTFSTPGTTTAGGAYGDIDLPTLSGTLSWDLSALSSHGIVAVVNVVPEPSRALLLLLGVFGLLARRRRFVG